MIVDAWRRAKDGALWVTLPLPPSANERLRPVVMGTARRIFARLAPTTALKAYKRAVLLPLRALARAHRRPPISRLVHLDLWVVLPDRRRDASNVDKVLLDMLQQAGLVANDRYLLPRYQGLGYDAACAGVTVRLPRGGA